MEAPHSPSFMDSPSPPNPYHKPTLSPFYYGLVVIGSTAIVLAVYNIVVVGCCKHQNRYRQNRRSTEQPTGETSRSFDNPNFQLISTFKYRKEELREYDNECAVCLSVFEDGEDVRKLPRCNHSFHTPCIDMWLYSHSDCPLCRATVEPPPPPPPLPHRISIQEEENSRESGSLV